MTMIRLLDARRGLYRKCEELFGDSKIAELIYRYLCDGIEECEDANTCKYWNSESNLCAFQRPSAQPTEDVGLPTVDAVEVVRCKDCAYYNGNNHYCDIDHYAVFNGYCYNGTRKKDPDADA